MNPLRIQHLSKQEWLLVWLALPSALVGLSAIAIAFLFGEQLNNASPSFSLFAVLLILSIIAGLIALLGAFFFYSVVRFGPWVEFREDGVLIKLLSGEQLMSWDQIGSVDTKRHLVEVQGDLKAIIPIPFVGYVRVYEPPKLKTTREIVVLGKQGEVFTSFYPSPMEDLELYRWMRRHYLRQVVRLMHGKATGGGSRVECVSFVGTGLSDEQLAVLAPLLDNIQELAELDLRGTPLTDQGIAPLFKLESLQRVQLEKTRVTANKQAELKKHLTKPQAAGGFAIRT